MTLRPALLSSLFVLASFAVGCGGSTEETSEPVGGGGGGGAAAEDAGADASELPDVGAADDDAAVDAADAGTACFPQYHNGGLVYVDYDKYHPTIDSTCSGTDHQEIDGVEKVVFLGDSITVGTPPTPASQYYQTVLTASLKQKFGDIETASCAEWGARNRDLLGKQIPKCFPGPEQKRTLVVMTSGGNDVAAWAKDKLPIDEASPKADAAVGELRDAVGWLKDPANFPNGSYVIFANVYEFTDLTANMDGCPVGAFGGFAGDWLAGAGVIVQMEQQYMQVAVDTKSDLVFLEEAFCGHGFHHADKASQCYLADDAPVWFDLTCIHPTPDGHAQIAKLFLDVVNE
jgi:lysophospholipase L1-like esterase